MNKYFFLFMIPVSSLALAQPSMMPPQVGFFTDNQHILRPVLGFGGNFVLGAALSSGIISSAASDKAVMVKTDSALAVMDPSGTVSFTMDAAPGPALFAFSKTGAPAFAYLSATGTLLAWNRDRFDTVADNFPGGETNVVALGSSGSRAVVVVQRADGLWRLDVSVPEGEILGQAALNGVSAPLALMPNGEIVYSTGQALGVRQADGSERDIDFANPVDSIDQLGSGWVHLVSTGDNFAARLSEGAEQIWQLPEGN